MTLESREPAQVSRPTLRRYSAKTVTGLMAGLIALPLAVGGSVGPVAAAGEPELVVNGGFENALTGWSAGATSRQKLTDRPRARTGSASARLTAKVADGRIVLDDATSTVASTVAGETYSISAYVRTFAKNVAGRLQIRESAYSTVVATAATDFTSTRTWKQVKLTYVAKTTGAQLDVTVLGLNVPARAGLFIDDVSAKRAAPSPTVQNIEATQRTTNEGVVDVAYATGTSDSRSSTFVTTVDGVIVDDETVSAPSGTGGYTATLAEDFSEGSADVVVTGNGVPILSFAVDTDRVAPPTVFPPTGPMTRKVFGMSAPASEWSSRVNQVGASGVKARRIFANLDSTGRNQSKLIDEAVAAGMMPVISYKVPDVDTLINGGYDSWMTKTKTYLASLDQNVTATFWHEPHGDMTPEQFRKASARFFDFMDDKDLAVGPILNGWLLDKQVSTFASYTDADLLNKWEWFGVDTYQAGTDASPDASKPGGRAVPILAKWLDAQGHANMPIGVGEYNGWTPESIDYGGDVLRNTPEVWFGLMWNSGPTGLGKPLEGQRLTEYIDDKAAPEVLR